MHDEHSKVRHLPLSLHKQQYVNINTHSILPLKLYTVIYTQYNNFQYLKHVLRWVMRAMMWVLWVLWVLCVCVCVWWCECCVCVCDDVSVCVCCVVCDDVSVVVYPYLLYICSACKWRPSLSSCTSLNSRRIMPSALSRSASTSPVCWAGVPAFSIRTSYRGPTHIHTHTTHIFEHQDLNGQTNVLVTDEKLQKLLVNCW